MKSLMPWICLIAAGSQVAFADESLEAYRQGNYNLAAETLIKQSDKDPVVNYYLGMMRLYGYGELKNNALALRYFTKAASNGYLPAQMLLGRYYLNGVNNPEQALVWFKKAADADDTSAQMYVAAAYLFGYGVKKNEDLARRYYIEAAKNGNAIAQYTLGMHFLDSRNKSNQKMGVIWLSKAADKGHAESQSKLAELYLAGGALPKDPVKAKDLFQAAARQNYLPAMVSLGEIAKKEGDMQAAREWFTQAANADYPSAQMALSKMYKDGEGGPADEALSLKWTEAANKSKGSSAPEQGRVAVAKWLSGNKARHLAFGDYRLNGIYNAWKNDQALKENIYNPAPEMNNITRQSLYKAQFVMTDPSEISIHEYFDTLAPMLSRNESKDWSYPRYDLDPQIESLVREESMVLNHDPDAPLADITTSRMDENKSEGFDYIAEKTPNWVHKVNFQQVLNRLYGEAILGNPSSQFELGQLYQYGIGVSKSPAQAIEYFQLAAAQQDVRAEYNLGLIYLEGQTDPVDYQTGLDWMTDAAFKGNAYAQYALANIYENGLKDSQGSQVVAPDHAQAMAMYYLASSNHFGPAEYNLADYLIREKQNGLSVAAKKHRHDLVKRLYQNAVKQGVAEAVLPLAFYNAVDSDPVRQKQAFEVAKHEAQSGNAQAALLLGMMFERGISVSKDQDEAILWYQRSAANPVNAFILGTYLSKGYGMEKDLVKGRELLQQSADAGFPYASLNLAVLKQQAGESFTADLDKARIAGNSRAGILLADYYLQEANDPEKMREASSIYEFFAEKGDKDAQVKLGFLYDKGLNGAINNEMAAKWYSAAAVQGQALGQYLLANMYQLGRIGQAPDYTSAKKWYTAAADKYSQAAVALGFIDDTVDNNYLDAEKHYTAAMAAGNIKGSYNLALIFENGKGVPVNFAKARELFKQAAEHGHAKSMTQLGNLYFQGQGGDKDEKAALEMYRKAAELGDSGAIYQLGLLSETGVAVEADLSQALKYYQQAASLGNEKAKMAVARMYQLGLGVSKDIASATDIYKQLAANSNAYAQYKLALIDLNEGQSDQARTLLSQSVENGSIRAKTMLQWLNAQKLPGSSFIAPLSFPLQVAAEESAEMMYLKAINEWNRGDEDSSRIILESLVKQFPNFAPAQKAWHEMSQQQV